MSFAELLPLVESAAEYLEDHTIKSKEELDRVDDQLLEKYYKPITLEQKK